MAENLMEFILVKQNIHFFLKIIHYTVLSYHVLLFIRLITSDLLIEEIDFEHNYIGDAAGREILHAMQQRRDGNVFVV